MYFFFPKCLEMIILYSKMVIQISLCGLSVPCVSGYVCRRSSLFLHFPVTHPRSVTIAMRHKWSAMKSVVVYVNIGQPTGGTVLSGSCCVWSPGLLCVVCISSLHPPAQMFDHAAWFSCCWEAPLWGSMGVVLISPQLWLLGYFVVLCWGLRGPSRSSHKQGASRYSRLCVMPPLPSSPHHFIFFASLLS